MYGALRALPIPQDAPGRMFRAATLLREHRGDGHIAALMSQATSGALADELAAKPYEALDSAEITELAVALEPLAVVLRAPQPWR